MSEALKLRELDEVVRREVSQLQDLLTRHGVAFEGWGEGATKTIRDLAIELIYGETELQEVESKTGKQLVRQASIVTAHVFFKSPETGATLRLTEERQEFNNGQTRTRPHMTESLAEKMKKHESPDKVLVRALDEELGIDIDHGQFEFHNCATITSPSQSYPGLYNQLTNHVFNAYLSPEQFNPDGYVEVQPDKTTCFRWEEL